MNRTQKASILALTIFLFCLLQIAFVITDMFIINPSESAVVCVYVSLWAICAMPFIVFLLIRKKQSPAEPNSDERDNTIKQKAAAIAFVAVWIFLIATTIIPIYFIGIEGAIPVAILPLINLVVFLCAMTIYSIAVLVQYRRGGKDVE